jgi:hypothetical protein
MDELVDERRKGVGMTNPFATKRAEERMAT